MNRRPRIRGCGNDVWLNMHKSTNRQSPAGFKIRRSSPRGARWGMVRSLILFGLLVTMLPSPGMNSARAQSPTGIRPLLRTPVAVRGSDLLIPLGSEGVRVRWPATMTARIGGKVVDVTVAWMEPDFSAVNNWVTPAEPIKVISRTYGPQELSDGRPLAIVPIPGDATGAIEATAPAEAAMAPWNFWNPDRPDGP